LLDGPEAGTRASLQFASLGPMAAAAVERRLYLSLAPVRTKIAKVTVGLI
jgi:hypothetical protein